MRANREAKPEERKEDAGIQEEAQDYSQEKKRRNRLVPLRGGGGRGGCRITDLHLAFVVLTDKLLLQF